MRLLGPAARATVALLLAGGGCTVLAPLGGLQGNGGGDAAPDALEDVGPEATGDVAASETGTGSDASDAAADTTTRADAEAGADAPPAPFCASLSPQPTLCADFDQGPFAAAFAAAVAPSPSDLGADSQYSVSPPNSMYAQIAQGDSISHTFAYLERTFTSTAKGADIALDVRPVSITNNASAVLAKISLDVGLSTQHDLGLVLSTTDRIEEGFNTADAGEQFLEHDFGTVMQVGQWTHLEIVLSLAQRTIEVRANGAQVLAPAALDASWPTSTNSLAVYVGFTYASSTSSAWSARYDDVVVSLM